MTSGRKDRKRLKRQVEALADKLPVEGGAIMKLLGRRATWVRVPVALLLCLGGIFAILPVLGVWMLPLGLLLLAFDLPLIRPFILRGVILGRRWVTLKWRALRGRDG